VALCLGWAAMVVAGALVHFKEEGARRREGKPTMTAPRAVASRPADGDGSTAKPTRQARD
jgi:hypothetical protein